VFSSAQLSCACHVVALVHNCSTPLQTILKIIVVRINSGNASAVRWWRPP